MNTQKKNTTPDESMQKLKLGALSKDKQDEISAQMGEVILKKIFIETVEKLSESEREEFRDLLEKGNNADEIESFLQTKIKEYDTMVLSVVNDVLDELQSDAFPEHS